MTSPNLPPPLPGQSGRSPVWVVSLCVAGTLFVLCVGVAVDFLTRGGLVGRGVDDEKHARGSDVDEKEQWRRETEQQERDRAELDRKIKELEDGIQTTPAAKNEENAKKPPVRNRDKRDLLKDIKARGNTLELPDSHQADLLARTIRFKMLAALYTVDPGVCRLRLLPGLDSPNGATFRLVKEMFEDPVRRVWSVCRTAGTGAGVEERESAESKVAMFELRESQDPKRV
jgi:hypothetical protein